MHGLIAHKKVRILQTPYISKIWYNNENIMTEMSQKEIKKFLMQGTLTGKLVTVKKDEALMSFQFGL
jgi:hypothetical protein